MHRLLLSLILALTLLPSLGPASVNAADCRFVLGFKTLHDAIPDIVGDCTTNERYNPPNQDAIQYTAKGMLVWRKSDNFTAFTDGYRTWVNGPYGVQQRLNTERFAWENDGSNETSQVAAVTTKPQPNPPPRPLTIWDIDGKALLVGDDGQYLGKVSSDRYDNDSICNKYGEFGGKYSYASVRNKYGNYGSPYASDSTYNKFSSTPPRIIYRGRTVGYLTKNKVMSGALDPDLLFASYDCVY